MNEIEIIERVALVLDAAIHMRAAACAGMALDRCGLIDDAQLVAILQNSDVLARYHGHDGEYRTVRLPAFGAAACMIMGDVTFDADFHFAVRAFADQRTAREMPTTCFDAAINRRMDMSSHLLILPAS